MRGMDNSVPIKVARWGRLASSPFIWVLFPPDSVGLRALESSHSSPDSAASAS